jgi:hypothetical protein
MAFDSWAMTQDNPEFLGPARARYAPSSPRVAGNLQVNVAAAKTAKLALS